MFIAGSLAGGSSLREVCLLPTPLSGGRVLTQRPFLSVTLSQAQNLMCCSVMGTGQPSLPARPPTFFPGQVSLECEVTTYWPL